MNDETVATLSFILPAIAAIMAAWFGYRQAIRVADRQARTAAAAHTASPYDEVVKRVVALEKSDRELRVTVARLERREMLLIYHLRDLWQWIQSLNPQPVDPPPPPIPDELRDVLAQHWDEDGVAK